MITASRHLMNDIKSFIRRHYAWPGGYPLTLFLSDGECLCPKCTKTHFREIVGALKRNEPSGWKPMAVDVIWESDYEIFCAQCNEPIEIAYPKETVTEDENDNS